jgi:hypothetical protein
MKKSLMYLSAGVLAVSALFLSSCNGDDDGDTDPQVVASLVKTVGVVYEGDGVETFEFIYDANQRVTSVNNIWTGEGEEPGEPSVIAFNYNVPNQLTITRDGSNTVYEIDASGRITKEFWDSEKTEWAAYEYDANGFMTKLIEHWGGEDHTKFTVDIQNENVIRHTRYNDEGAVNRIKEFKFITSGSGNLSALQQTNVVDSSWKVIGGFYGKASKQLVSSLDYWDGPGDEENLRTTNITYPSFDAKGRITEMVRSGDGWSESYTYSYYED